MTSESKKYRNKVEGLEHQVSEAERAKKDVEDELYRQKQLFDSACSQATSKLNKVEVELAATRGDLEQAR